MIKLATFGIVFAIRVFFASLLFAFREIFLTTLCKLWLSGFLAAFCHTGEF
jgi:hypothetical protein